MKLSLPPAKTNLFTSPSLAQRLDLYALACGAAGVSLLALAQPAEAEVVYTPAHVAIGYDGTYNLDLNHDGIADFTVKKAFTHTSSGRRNALFLSTAPAGNGWMASVSQYGRIFVSALKPGALIDGKKHFIDTSGVMAAESTLAGSGNPVGKWLNVNNLYLGLKFVIDGQTHYGWARLSVHVKDFSIITLLTGYAYETTPSKPIRAGQTSETAADAAFTPGSEVQGDSASAGSVAQGGLPLQPASLCMLALGAQGLPVWRREE